MSTPVNPPAFPVVGHNIDVPWRGMTLLDYFAAAALQGMLCSMPSADQDYAAERAYELADAMLKAREEL